MNLNQFERDEMDYQSPGYKIVDRAFESGIYVA